MATKHLYSVVAKLISFWPDLNDWPTEWLTVKLKTNNNKPTKISHNFLLLSKFYAGLLIWTLHLPEPWYPTPIPILRQNISVPLSIRPLKFFDTPRLTYPGHDLSWHAVSRVSGTWHCPTRHVSRHVALWSATRQVSWNITALKIPRNYSFHARKGKNIFQLRKSLKVG